MTDHRRIVLTFDEASALLTAGDHCANLAQGDAAIVATKAWDEARKVLEPVFDK